jgi:multicomponent Na+:H+ antiporter subunit D
VLRATGRVFRGWGEESERDDEYHVRGGEVDPELRYRHDRVPLTMTIPTVALLTFGLALGLVPGLPDAARDAAARFTDRGAYAATVLAGHAPPGASSAGRAEPFDGPHAVDWLYALLSLAGAIGLAWMALARGPLRDLPGDGPAGRAVRATLAALRGLHTGQVTDYVTWLVAGTALLGLTWAITIG